MIRSLLDIRLSRFSLAVLATVSVLATVVIITNGSSHTAAQLTALAALREPPRRDGPDADAGGPGPGRHDPQLLRRLGLRRIRLRRLPAVRLGLGLGLRRRFRHWRRRR